MLQFCVAIKYSLQVSLDDVNIQQLSLLTFCLFMISVLLQNFRYFLRPSPFIYDVSRV